MCGRFTLTADGEEVATAFDVARPLPALTPRYNVAPSQVVAVVGLKPDGRRGLALLRWGLVQHWSENATPKVRPINVQAESVRRKFGGLLRKGQCLIPADGFIPTTMSRSGPPHYQATPTSCTSLGPNVTRREDGMSQDNIFVV